MNGPSVRPPRRPASHHAKITTAGPYCDQTSVVTFGPDRPVHFDIQIPHQGHDCGGYSDEPPF
ncbi:hypothetical protein [Streptomyces sp. NPDC006463]|uniref:hypothetical protein n=1 Tax=Streptomyces sp. NPDC006463 TaxID=3364746 RepID=UPI0036A6071E